MEKTGAASSGADLGLWRPFLRPAAVTNDGSVRNAGPGEAVQTSTGGRRPEQIWSAGRPGSLPPSLSLLPSPLPLSFPPLFLPPPPAPFPPSSSLEAERQTDGSHLLSLDDGGTRRWTRRGAAHGPVRFRSSPWGPGDATEKCSGRSFDGFGLRRPSPGPGAAKKLLIGRRAGPEKTCRDMQGQITTSDVWGGSAPISIRSDASRAPLRPRGAEPQPRSRTIRSRCPGGAAEAGGRRRLLP